MRPSRFEQFLPAAGIVGAALFVVFAFVGGSPPDAGSTVATQLTWYGDHHARVIVGSFAGSLFLVAMVFFATGIRQALRSGESSESTYSSVAYAGGLLSGFAVAMWSWLGYAAAGAAADEQGTALHTLGYLVNVAWLPWVAATAPLLLAAGIGGLRTSALPKWLAIITIVLGVACLTGAAGIAVYAVMPLWLVVTSVVLLRRQSSSSPPAGRSADHSTGKESVRQ